MDAGLAEVADGEASDRRVLPCDREALDPPEAGPVQLNTRRPRRRARLVPPSIVTGSVIVGISFFGLIRGGPVASIPKWIRSPRRGGVRFLDTVARSVHS